MGEFADYALDETMDAEFDRMEWRLGLMSDLEAFDRGIIDSQGFEPSAFTGRSRWFAVPSDFDVFD